MPQRKNFAASVAERQETYRSRADRRGMVRREYYLPASAVEDEAVIKARLGPDRVRQLICHIFAQQRAALDKQTAELTGAGKA